MASSRIASLTQIVLILSLGWGACGPAERTHDPRASPGRADSAHGTTGERSPAARVIVIASIDTLRSDHLPAYGYEAVETPQIDRLRADALLYERAYSPIPLTLPAHASLFTGRLPPEHGVRDNAGYRLAPEHTTLAERLSAAGFRTGGFVSSFVLRAETGIAQGFERYDAEVEVVGRGTLADSQRAGAATTRAAVRWLDEVRDEPFLLFLHLYEPHTPYTPPEPYASRFALPYDGEIAAADAALGVLLDELGRLGLYDGALIVLLSDHGEGLGEHGEDQHGVLLHRESLQVPLLLKLPGGRDGGSSRAVPVQLTDVAPTVLEAAGIVDEDPFGSGRSLFGIDRDGGGERALFAETFYPQLRLGWHGMVSVIRGDRHLVSGAYPELFDLGRDPAEVVDLSEREPAVLAALERELDGYAADLEAPQSLDADDRAALQSLGYLAGSVDSAGGAELPDPRREVRSLGDLYAAIEELRAGRAAGAAERLRRVVTRHPRLLDAWQFLGIAESDLGDEPAAYEAYREAFELAGPSSVVVVPLARLAYNLGRHEEAAELLAIAIGREPERVDLRAYRTQSLLALGRLDEALAAARDNAVTVPASLDLRYQLATVHMARRELDVAEQQLRSVLAAAPEYVPALSDLAVLLSTLERWPEAREILVRLVELRPGDRALSEHLAYVERQLEQASR